MNHPHTLLLALLALLLMGCGKGEEKKGSATKAQPANTIKIDHTLRTRLEEFARQPRPQGKFGLYVYDLTADKPVFAYNENAAQPSASCLKLLTGVAGIHLLGEHYRYYTSLYTRGRTTDGTLHGDIGFRAGLDPQLLPPDMQVFARALRRRGISRFNGRLYLDLLLKEPIKSEPHWYPWDLSFSHYGLLYKGHERVARELKAALRAGGISVADSQLVVQPIPRGSQCIFSYSRGLDPVVKRMWKNSSNTQATSLLYTIGHHYQPKASPAQAGVAYLRKFMREELRLTDSTLVIHDGCGLCTHNRLSPRALVTILQYGYRNPATYRMLMRHLSIAGTDGTLRSALPGADTRGKVYGKTGTLSHPFGISSLAGFCRSSNGHLLAFAIMDSEMSVLDAHVLQRKLCKVLVKTN